MRQGHQSSLIPYRQFNTDRLSPYPKETYGFAVDGTPLIWYVVEPDANVFPPPWPAAPFGHIGGFKNGSPLEAKQITAAVDCAANGIMGVLVQYRMDKQKVAGQPQPVFWPCEADDFKQAVVALRNDSRVIPEKVFVVGASTGADLALHAVCDTAGNVSGFNNWSAADRAKFAVLMSGPFKFEDRTADPYLKTFIANVNLYCQSTDVAVQATKSSLTQMTSDCPPLYLAHYTQDTMPIAQYNAIIAKIAELSLANCDSLLVDGVGHGYDLWPYMMADGVMDWILARLTD